LCPSLRGREAAEAIQAGDAARDRREAYRVVRLHSGLLRARFARARNDGGAAVPHVTGGRRGRGRRHRHCEAAKRPKQSRRAGPRVARARRGHRPFPRHCEAAKPPKQSRRKVPRIPCGRRTVWCGCILDCFARAPRGLAMTEGRPALESRARGGGTAVRTKGTGGLDPAADRGRRIRRASRESAQRRRRRRGRPPARALLAARAGRRGAGRACRGRRGRHASRGSPAAAAGGARAIQSSH